MMTKKNEQRVDISDFYDASFGIYKCPIEHCNKFGVYMFHSLAQFSHHIDQVHTRLQYHYYCPIPKCVFKVVCVQENVEELIIHMAVAHHSIFENRDEIDAYLKTCPIIKVKYTPPNYINPHPYQLCDALMKARISSQLSDRIHQYQSEQYRVEEVSPEFVQHAAASFN